MDEAEALQHHPDMLSHLDLALIDALRQLTPAELEEALERDVLPVAGPPEERQALLNRLKYLRRYVNATRWEG